MQSVELMEGFPWDLVAGVTLLAPMYVALFLYGYGSSAIWSGQAERRRFTLPFLKTNADRWFAVVIGVSSVPLVIILEAFALWSFPNLLFAPIVGLALRAAGHAAIGADSPASASGLQHAKMSGL